MKYGTLTSNDIQTSMRIDGSFHLSDGVALERLISKKTHKPLIEFCDSVFTAGRRKRIYTKKEYGYPYLSNSDVIAQNPFDSCKYNSRKYGYDESAFLKAGMILTGRVGAIGQTAYVTREFETKEAMGSDNIIRIIAKQSELGGYLYAFLVSKIGNTLLWKLAAGGVQPYITDQMVANIPVPVFPESKQKEIHNLIVESANLRVEANQLLEEAQNRIVSMLDIDNKVEIRKDSIKNILTSHQKRFESHYYKSIGSIYRDKILQLNHILLNDASERIFRPGIFKRNYVKDGIDFLGGSDITKHIPNSEKKLSKKQTSNFDELTLKEDWILVTCGGTIGTSVLVNSYLANKLASQHILRVIPKGLKSGYLFAFLSSEIGLKVIQSFTYGSVIPQIEPHHLELIPIPLFANEIMDEIHLSVMKYKCNLNEAIIKENQAISLVEKEIESWQQS